MNRWKTILIAIPLVSLGVILAVAQNPPLESSSATEIKVTAKKYEFDPGTIRVPKASHVKLVITSLDRDHGIKLEAFHIDQKLPKGEPVTIEFDTADPGTFPFECSKFCGLGHKKMKGELVVE